MRIVPFSEVPGADWDRVAGSSPQAWLFHRSAWIGIETKHFGPLNLSFAVEDGGRIVGILPLYLNDGSSGTNGEILLNSGIHRHTGLALLADLTPSQVASARAQSMAHLWKLAESTDCERIQLNGHNLAPENLSPRREEIPFWVHEHGFFLGIGFASFGMLAAPGITTCCADQIVDLSASEEVLFGNLSDPCRRAVRKAERHGLEFEAVRDGNPVEVYYSLARRSAQRTGEPLPNVEYYADVWSLLHREGRCAVMMSRLDGRPVAALFLLVDKGGVSFMAGVSDPDYLDLRVNDHVHWSTILWAKRDGQHHYRLGPWFPEVPRDWPIARVSAFKKKFGARPWTTIQGSYFRRRARYVEQAQMQLAQLAEWPQPGDAR